MGGLQLAFGRRESYWKLVVGHVVGHIGELRFVRGVCVARCAYDDKPPGTRSLKPYKFMAFSSDSTTIQHTRSLQRGEHSKTRPPSCSELEWRAVWEKHYFRHGAGTPHLLLQNVGVSSVVSQMSGMSQVSQVSMDLGGIEPSSEVGES